MASRILVADDQPDVLEALRLLLKAEGFETQTASSPAGVLHAVEKGDFDLVLMDLNYTRDTTSGKEGLGLLSELREMDGTLPVVVMTAWGSVDGAVEAMRRGARDYIEKPWDNERLLTTIRTHVELGRALRRSQRLESENRNLKGEGVPELIAGSKAMQPVLDVIERVGTLGCQRPHRRRARHRARRSWHVGCTTFPAARRAPGPGERRRVQRGRVRERALRTREGRLHRREDAIESDASSWRTGARSSWTRSRTSRCSSRRSCCGSSRPVRSSAWARPRCVV